MEVQIEEYMEKLG